MAPIYQYKIITDNESIAINARIADFRLRYLMVKKFNGFALKLGGRLTIERVTVKMLIKLKIKNMVAF